jgi:predicted pyridoxine 5'-phosphate oxidase superfamily flavin-nucleotide-binding protein
LANDRNSGTGSVYRGARQRLSRDRECGGAAIYTASRWPARVHPGDRRETLGFADYTGNRQYITTGNLAENDRALLFLMDYAERRRVKLWGRARVVEDDADLMARLDAEGL